MKTINKNRTIWYIVFSVGAAIMAGVFLFSQSVWATPSKQGATPILISYQGTLTDEGGDPITGNVEMIFNLYNAAEGGTPFWTESYTGAEAISVTDGQFHVLLGSRTTLNPTDLSGNLYLGITVNGEEMLPREVFAYVPFAIQGSHLVTNNTPDVKLDSGGVEIHDENGHTLRIDGNELDSTEGLRLQREHSDRSVVIYSNLNMGGNAIDSIGNMDFGSSVGNKSYWYGNAYYTGIEGNTLYDVSNRYFRWYDASTGPDGGTNDVMQLDADSGNVWLKGDMKVGGNNIRLGDTAVLRRDSSRTLHLLPWGGAGHDYDNVCIGCGSDANLIVRGSVSCGALTEANLQTTDELAAERIDRFEEGDVLCWTGNRLEKCSVVNDSLVQAVAGVDGRPIIIGAEVVKVLGPVQYGDLLVASETPGFAMVNNDPRPGSVIAQALEDFDDEQGIIKAMIRKF